MTPAGAAVRARAAALAFVVLGVALRWATAYPAHKYAADADCLNSGYVALRILDGHTPAWYTPRRIGSLECWIHAAVFRVLGPTREALAVAPLLSGSLALVLFAALALPLLGPVAGPTAVLLFALPPPAYLFWTYMPNGYPETLLLCVAALWAADRARRKPGDAARLAVFGVVAGLGFWNSIQTLSVSLPSALWLAVGNRRSRGWRAAGITAAAFAFGAAPWIAWNVAVPFGSFRNNFSVQPVAGASALLDNLSYLVRYALPELVASVDLQNRAGGGAPLASALRPLVLALWGAAALAALARAGAWIVRRKSGAREPLAEAPFLLLAGVVCVLAVVSGAGAMRGLTVRYVLPLYLALAPWGGLLAASAFRRSRLLGAAAAAALAAVLAFNAAGWTLPGSADRRLWEKRRDADSDLLAFLEERGVEAVAGDYWSAYPVNFLSRRRIAGVPFQAGVDFYDVEGSLGDRPLRWAVVGTSRTELETLAGRTGVSGLLVEVSNERWVFLPQTGPEGAPVFLGRFRTAFLEQR